MSIDLLLSGDESLVKEVHNHIKDDISFESILSKRNNIDGDVATWIVVSSLVAQVIPGLLTFVSDRLESNRVSKIKLGEFEVENPSKEMIDYLIKKYKSEKEEKNSG